MSIGWLWVWKIIFKLAFGIPTKITLKNNFWRNSSKYLSVGELWRFLKWISEVLWIHSDQWSSLFGTSSDFNNLIEDSALVPYKEWKTRSNLFPIACNLKIVKFVICILNLCVERTAILQDNELKKWHYSVPVDKITIHHVLNSVYLWMEAISIKFSVHFGLEHSLIGE